MKGSWYCAPTKNRAVACHDEINETEACAIAPPTKNRAVACHDEINETEVALPRIDRCALYDGFCCRQEPTSLLSPSHLVDAGKAANPIQHTESACGIRFTSSTTCTLLW